MALDIVSVTYYNSVFNFSCLLSISTLVIYIISALLEATCLRSHAMS